MEDCVLSFLPPQKLIESNRKFVINYSLICKVNHLHRQDNSNALVVAHQVEDQDTSNEMTECRYHRVTGLHPLRIPRSNPDVHPNMEQVTRTYSSLQQNIFYTPCPLVKLIVLIRLHSVRSMHNIHWYSKNVNYLKPQLFSIFFFGC